MFLSKIENQNKKEKQGVKSKISQKLVSSFLFLVISFYSLNAEAQCAMCRASLESSGNVSQAEAVNNGIVYLMIIPYVLVALVGIAVYKMFRKKKS